MKEIAYQKARNKRLKKKVKRLKQELANLAGDIEGARAHASQVNEENYLLKTSREAFERGARYECEQLRAEMELLRIGGD